MIWSRQKWWDLHQLSIFCFLFLFFSPFFSLYFLGVHSSLLLSSIHYSLFLNCWLNLFGHCHGDLSHISLCQEPLHHTVYFPISCLLIWYVTRGHHNIFSDINLLILVHCPLFNFYWKMFVLGVWGSPLFALLNSKEAAPDVSFQWYRLRKDGARWVCCSPVMHCCTGRP